MTFGFTVDELVAAGRRGAAPQMGLARMSEAHWLQPDFDRPVRAAAFDTDPDAVRMLPGAEDAAREVAALIGTSGGLAEAGRAVWEDLCILQPGADGRHILTAGALAFPTDWSLADKIGLPLGAVHAPVHGYAGRLEAGVDHFVRTLAPGPIHARANWFVVSSAAWAYRPQGDPAARFAHVDAANAGETLFVRCERQTLRRLPQTGALLFTIGIAVAPLNAVSDATVARLASATPPPGSTARASAPHYASALAGYAAGRAVQAA